MTWSAGPSVTADGTWVVAHAGSGAVRLLAARSADRWAVEGTDSAVARYAVPENGLVTQASWRCSALARSSRRGAPSDTRRSEVRLVVRCGAPGPEMQRPDFCERPW